MKISLLATGTELLDGRIKDENGVVLGQRLAEYGLRLHHMLCCGDTAAEIFQGLKLLLDDSDLIVISGGLGPTAADQTRDAFGLELVYDPASEERLRTMVASRKRAWSDTLLKQCYLPKDAKRFENPVGSADPFVLTMGTTTIVAVPGVPREFLAILDTLILPQIKELALRTAVPLLPLQERNYRIIGLSESQVAEYLKQSNLPESIDVFIRADYPEIQVVLRSDDKDESFTASAGIFESTLPRECVFGNSLQISFEETFVSLLQQKNKTIATAESCTGGLIASMLTKVPGSSQIYKGSIVAYDNRIKTDLLEVAASIIQNHGAVSAECARSMAEQIRQKCQVDIGLSVTGIAGPGGGTAEKPVGTVFFAIATATGTTSYKIFFPDSRLRIQQYSSFAALDEVRRSLLELPARFAAV